MGKPSSAYGWSGVFSPGSPVSHTFDERSARYKRNILERAVKHKSKKKKKKKKKKNLAKINDRDTSYFYVNIVTYYNFP